MKIKVIALSFLLTTVAVQAEQIKMPSLETLKSRLKESRIGIIYPDQRKIFFDSRFVEDIADKKINSNYLAVMLRRVAVAFVASNRKASKIYMSCVDNGGNYYEALSLANKEAAQRLTGYLKEKIAENPDLAEELFRKYVADSYGFREYNFIIDDLYKIFFKGYEEILHGLSRDSV